MLSSGLPAGQPPIVPGGEKTVPPPTHPNPATSLAKHALSGAAPAASSHPILAENLTPLFEETDEQAIKNRDGYLWECVGRKEVLDGQTRVGFMYRFRLRDKFDENYKKLGENGNANIAIERMNRELFPAEEGTLSTLTEFAFNRSEYKKKIARGETEMIPLGRAEFHEIGKELGYVGEANKEGKFITLPDKEVLEHRWKRVVSGKELRVLSSKEIASDREFIDAFGKSDILLSTGREFVHDHLAHAITTLTLMTENYQKYVKFRKAAAVTINKMVADIAKVRKWVEESVSKLPKDLDNPKGKEYLARLQRNMAHADVIPAIYADLLAAQSDVPSAEVVAGVGDFLDMNYRLNMYDDFMAKRVSQEVAEKYEQENRAEIPKNVLEKSVKDISLDWLSRQIGVILELVSQKNER